MPKVQNRRQSRSKPNNTPSPTHKLPQGQSVHTGSPRLWSTDVFCLANSSVCEKYDRVANFSNASDFIPKTPHFRLLENIFKKSGDLAIPGSRSHTGTAAWGCDAAAPSTRDRGTCSPGLRKAWESEAWASQQDRQGSLRYVISSLCGLGPMNAVPQFPPLCTIATPQTGAWCPQHSGSVQ